MLSLLLPFEVLLFSEPADLRKSYDGLAALVREHLDRDVLDGGLFVFLNKRRNRIKLLFWDRDGFLILQKRLEVGVFSRPRRMASEGDGRSIPLSAAELALLLEGIEVLQARRSPRYRRANDRRDAARQEHR
jgi:transposase